MRERSALKSPMPSTPSTTASPVDHELLEAILQRRLDDPRISVGPIVAASAR
jgi:hypothetical protein